MPRLLSTAEAAAALGVSVQAVRLAIAEGRLKADKFGNQWTITKKAVNAYQVNPVRKACGETKRRE